MCGYLSFTSNWGSGTQPRHVPWLGIELVTHWFIGQCSILWATPSRMQLILFSSKLHSSNNTKPCSRQGRDKTNLLAIFSNSNVGTTRVSPKEGRNKIYNILLMRILHTFIYICTFVYYSFMNWETGMSNK